MKMNDLNGKFEDYVEKTEPETVAAFLNPSHPMFKPFLQTVFNAGAASMLSLLTKGVPPEDIKKEIMSHADSIEETFKGH